MDREPGSSVKVTARHLQRRAVVYMRQSSGQQVMRNQESQRLQRQLVVRARSLGWRDAEVLAADLGSSASLGAGPRPGFDRLLASVARGEVGMVFSLEASRLSRTDKDWCRLLEVCQVFDTLVGDATQVYDLSLLDDQLVLGIKATMSVAESRVLTTRLIGGMFEKAGRGELVRQLPPGYVRDPDGVVQKDPDLRVQQAIELIFRTFQECWTIRGTHKWFQDHAVELPVNKVRSGRMQIVWQVPTHSFIQDVLRNPFYAGAYVFGRRATKLVYDGERVVKRQVLVLNPMDCRVFIPDHHAGYIDMTTYEENRKRIAGNNVRSPTSDSVAAIREGRALLAGMLRCGRCGRRFNVRYWGRQGTSPRYLCSGDYALGGQYCVRFGAVKVDRRVEEEVLRVISPLGIQAGLDALATLNDAHDDEREALALRLQQLEFEAQRAFEQFDQVDPRNRLVAGELEQRWNQALEEVDRTRTSLTSLEAAPPRVDATGRRRILQLGEHFEKAWRDPACTPDLKKKILRTVIEEIIVNVDADRARLELIIHWSGGTHTQIDMPKPRSGAEEKTAPEDLEVIRKMAPRYDDEEIARVLTRLGRRTARDLRWTGKRVAATRRKYRIHVGERRVIDPDVLSLNAAARHCDVSQTTIKRLVAAGLVPMEQVVPWAPWEIQKADLETDAVTAVLDRLRHTGRLGLGGVHLEEQGTLFPC